jgi:hypothetical protein
MGFEVVFEILAALKKMSDEAEAKRAEAAWRQGVLGLLGQLIVKSEEILSDLRKLRVDISNILDAKFRSVYLASLQGYTQTLMDIIAGLGSRIDAAERQRLEENIDDLRTLIYESGAYGFAAIPASLTAYSALIAIMRAVKIDPDEIKSTRAGMWKLVFQPAVAPNVSGNLLWAKDFAASEAAAAKLFVENNLRPMTIGIKYDQEGAPGPNEFPKFVTTHVTTTYSGDIRDPGSIRGSGKNLNVLKGFLGLGLTWATVTPAPPPVTAAYFDRDIDYLYGNWEGQIRLMAQTHLEQVEVVAALSRLIGAVEDTAKPQP